MEWKLAHPLEDVQDIIEMGLDYLSCEQNGVLRTSVDVFRKCLTITATVQIFDKSKEFLAVCRDEGRLVGYCWFDRGGYTTYSSDEISNAKFHHVALDLPVRQRVKILHAMIDQHILWANSLGIPVICSTSIRGDHVGFMKIHEKRGFQVTGSYAWIKTSEGIRRMNGTSST
jgi:hypothetical protein